MTYPSGPMPPPDPGGGPYYGPSSGAAGPYPGAPGQYGAPYGSPAGGYGGAPGRAPSNGLGIGALIVGILSLVTVLTFFGSFAGWLLGIIAVVLGFLGRSKAKKGEADNGGMALAGIITGAIGFVLSVVFMIIIVAVVWAVGNSANNYLDCVNNAHGDQDAINQCAYEYNR